MPAIDNIIITSHNVIMKTSSIWMIPKDTLFDLMVEKKCLSDVIRYLGLSPRGSSNHHRLKQRFEKENIEWRSLLYKKGENPNTLKAANEAVTKYSLDELLVENSTYPRTSLKKRLLADNLLNYNCYVCDLKEWLGKPIKLQLDHINGIFNDNRIENLRLLCPNCHSQTDTFAGRNKPKKQKRQKRKKVKAKHKINFVQKQCKKKPSKNELQIMLWEIPTTKIAENYKVSDTAVAKWARKWKLTKPPRGYWSKI